MKTYQHIIFWILVYGILTLIFASWFGGYDEAYYFVSLLLPVVMGTSYFFNYYLVPRFLFTRKFRKFVIYSFYMLVVSLCLELLASVISMLVIVKFGINQAGPLVTDVYTLAGIMYFIVLFKSFILLIKHYFVDQQVIGQLEENRPCWIRGISRCVPTGKPPGSVSMSCCLSKAWQTTSRSIWKTGPR
jgi:two-component system response regulator LytT